MGPDFSNYSYQQLLQSFRNVNRNKFPDRFEEILSEIKKKKPEDIEVVKVQSGYRFLRRDQIPKPLKSHQPKTFSYTTGTKEYNSHYLKASVILIPLTLAVLIRIWTSDWSYKYELLIGIPALIFLSFLIAFFFHNSINKENSLTFYNEYIEEKRGKKCNIYCLNELRIIETHDAEKSYVDIVTLYFEKNRKLSITNFEPFYSEVKNYLKEYLSKRMNYEQYLDSSSKL
jgi:hypothetical protein